jgi:hypothetical protein
VSFLN